MFCLLRLFLGLFWLSWAFFCIKTVLGRLGLFGGLFWTDKTGQSKTQQTKQVKPTRLTPQNLTQNFDQRDRTDRAWGRAVIAKRPSIRRPLGLSKGGRRVER